DDGPAGAVREISLITLLTRHALVVLRREDDSVDAIRRAVGIVLDGHLAFGVRADELQLAGPPQLRVILDQPVRAVDGQWHQRFRPAAAEADHPPWVAGPAKVHAHGDVRRLRVQVAVHLAGIRRETDVRVHIADLADRVADDLLHDRRRQVGLRGDLP